MGIYVHIPFCRSKCFYCGFYSVVSLQWKEAYIAALCREKIICQAVGWKVCIWVVALLLS